MNKLRRMEIFRAVVEAGKFTQAAQNLGLSKSAVSHAISNLETYLGTQLLNRDNRKIQLTSDGESYYEQCCHILSELAALEGNYRDDKQDIDGHISITAPITFGVTRIAPIVGRFMTENPKVDISISLADHSLDLVQAGLDIGIRIGHLSNSSIRARKLTSVQMELYASPDFLKAHPELKTISDLELIDTLRYRWTPKWRFTREGENFTFRPKGRLSSDSGEALVEFAVQGLGVCFMPEFIARTAIEQGLLVRMLPDYEGEWLPVHAVFPPGRHRSARVKKLLDYLVEEFRSDKL